MSNVDRGGTCDPRCRFSQNNFVSVTNINYTCYSQELLQWSKNKWLKSHIMRPTYMCQIRHWQNYSAVCQMQWYVTNAMQISKLCLSPVRSTSKIKKQMHAGSCHHVTCLSQQMQIVWTYDKSNMLSMLHTQLTQCHVIEEKQMEHSMQTLLMHRKTQGNMIWKCVKCVLYI